MFCKNNPTKIFKDGVLKMSISYTYDADGYPISVDDLTFEYK